MEYGLYILALAGLLLLLALGAPFWLGRMLCPALTFALMRRLGSGLHRFFSFIKPDLDIILLVKAANRYYARDYRAAPFSERAIFLPVCLCPRGCPAPVSKEDGLLCAGQCPDCSLGRLRREAAALGYGWIYVVPSSQLMKNENLPPSSQFIKNKITQHAPRAALGVICAWHLRNRLLPSHKKIGSKGYVSGGKKGTALYGVLLRGRNCRQASVDWEEVRTAMALTEKG
ncbi:MAG: DUF116 domain-containing protein [Desulfarculales bacterium]|jgi:hypothetical protein|nr:DUF116 domain-containing protein [Desulfarculales bacterium]